MAFNIFCARALEGRPITVFGDGHQTRDFTFVSDVVAATRAAADAPVQGQVYNVGGGSQTTLAEALGIIEELVGRKLEVELTSARRGDVRDTGADTTRARMDLGYRCRTGLREGLREEFEWIADRRRRAAIAE
jgi:UDP-glucose 4-epimerase